MAPEGFQGCKSGLRADLWLPLGMDNQIWGGARMEDRGNSWLQVLAVLKPGVDEHHAVSELNVLMQRIANDPNGDNYNSPPLYSACSQETNCATSSSQPQGTFIFSSSPSQLAQAFLSISSEVLRLSK